MAPDVNSIGLRHVAVSSATWDPRHGRPQMNPSRRKFLAALAGTGGAMLLGPDRLRSAEIDPRVAQIVSGTIAVDMHSHVQMRFLRNPADTRPDPDLDIAGEMKRAGFSAV